jgi:phospholipid/cholesterol/gamma-HCH transport system substrate-binding protein
MSRVARIGAFIFSTFAILVIGIFIIGSKKYLFTPTYALRARFANVAGLNAGADVQVAGVHCGTVRAIDLPLRAGDQVTVLMDMNSSTHGIIRRDSVASIETEGILGSQYVAVSVGSASKPETKEGETIGSIPPLEMSALFDKAKGLLEIGQAAMNNIVIVTKNLDSVSAKIDRGEGTVGALVNDPKLYNNLEQTTNDAREAVAAARVGITDFQENMEAMKHNVLLRGYFKSRGFEDSSDLQKNEIEVLPASTVPNEFTFQAKQMFDKQDSAKLKNEKALEPAGHFLAGSGFGVAVIVASTGATGDTDDDLVLAQARIMVVRNYLVEHYAFDDTRLKSIALGKQSDDTSESGWGLVKILIYPTGTPVPGAKTPDKSAVQIRENISSGPPKL